MHTLQAEESEHQTLTALITSKNMVLSTTRNAVIYTAQQNVTITLNLWNKSDAIVPGLNVKSTQDVFNNNDTMDIGAPNGYADTIHVVELNEGEVLKAWCEVEGAVEYTIVTN